MHLCMRRCPCQRVRFEHAGTLWSVRHCLIQHPAEGLHEFRSIEATRVFAMTDPLGMEVFQDEVHFNNIIEVCARLRETGGSGT